jgi:hypothetical protein
MTTTTTGSIETLAFEALRTAQVHEHKGAMPSSAKLNSVEAEKAFNLGRFDLVFRRAIRSVEYSVGIFHADHARLKALAVEAGVEAVR